MNLSMWFIVFALCACFGWGGPVLVLFLIWAFFKLAAYSWRGLTQGKALDVTNQTYVTPLYGVWRLFR